MDYFKDKRGYFWEIKRRILTGIKVFLISNITHCILILIGVKSGRGTKFWGFPFIKRYPMTKIVFGKNCRFNSLHKTQEMYVYRPCSFVTTDKGAEIIIGNNVGCTGTSFVAVKRIIIGDNVLIGNNVTIADTDFHHADPSKRTTRGDPRPVEIQNNVFIGMNSVILKGVTIGENSVIGANSVVLTSIQPNSIALGNPCKVIMKRNWGNKIVE